MVVNGLNALFPQKAHRRVREREREKGRGGNPLIGDNFTELLLLSPLRAHSYQGERGLGNVLWGEIQS